MTAASASTTALTGRVTNTLRSLPFATILVRKSRNVGDGQCHPESGLGQVRDLAGHRVGAATGAPRHDEVDGPGWIFLLAGRRPGEHQDQHENKRLHGRPL
jgi:hypothetical protein